MIQIEHLVKYYGDHNAVDDVSFRVRPGEILGFLGPNGAGKSTTMNILTGYLSATSGTVRVDGHDILEEPQVVKSLIGYLPESPPLYNEMVVDDYLRFVAALKSIPRGDLKKEIDRVVSIVRIQDVRDRLVGNLSKGYRQRVGLAQALLGNPKVLILDEPTSGLDPKQIIDIRNLIRDLGKEHTVILSSHILSEIQEICSRVLIINRGRLVADEVIGDEHVDLQNSEEISITIEGPAREVENRLRQVPGVRDVRKTYHDNSVFVGDLVFDAGRDARRDVFFELSRNRWPILNLKPMGRGLEDIFLRVTASDYVPPVVERDGGEALDGEELETSDEIHSMNESNVHDEPVIEEIAVTEENVITTNERNVIDDQLAKTDFIEATDEHSIETTTEDKNGGQA